MAKNETSNFKSTVARHCKARAEAQPQQANKWAIEQTKLTTELMADFFAKSEINVNCLKTMALYAVQKVRKLAMFATDQKATVDPATMEVLRAAKKLLGSHAFTPGLQQAALSKGVECADPGIAKLTKRGNYSKGTAASQSQTTRLALVEMGVASVEVSDGRKNCLVVDFKHPIVKKLFGDEDGK